jgi:hypothetical protein
MHKVATSPWAEERAAASSRVVITEVLTESRKFSDILLAWPAL